MKNVKNNRKNLKINSGGGYPRWSIYLDMLKRIEQKEINIKNAPVIVNSISQSFIVDKKYEKICNILLKKYEKKLNRLPFLYRVKYMAAIYMIVATALASKENVEKSYAKEIVLEKEANRDDLKKEYKYEESEIDDQNELKSLIDSPSNIVEKVEEEENIYETYLREYSKYFHFDSKMVIELAKKCTNNYTNFENIISKEYEVTSPESACMLFVYLLYRGNLDIEYNKEELVINQEVSTAPHDDLNNFYLSTGEKYSVFLGKICDLFQIEDKSIVLSDSFTEISMQGSYSSNTRNNFGGMKYNGEHLSYPTPEAGIICFCGNFKMHYDAYTMISLEELACYHITGKKEMPNPEENKELCNEIISWEKSVESFYYEISENYENYFWENNEEDYALKLFQNK